MSKKTKWILVITWMVIIFWFSNQPAVISDEKSKFVIHVFKVLGFNLDSILGDLANFIVRKVGHFTEYLILYVLLFNALLEDFNFKKSLMVSLFIVFVYACSDEIHQIFIPGRTARIRDVIIDTCGGSFAMLVIYLKQKSLLKKKP
ncbi:VanZ family protein [Clostridium sp. OS1-26]|uniref:VanZ family protein n=1 Tax=Clostridium sp. OS1-26 TaxID=3070681 RepID=UPI0027DFDF20|nr:VanZ family protein [Clostridium sp. OS1-26]WML36475.1 VanZ family protein [Clostridium sp. OS1-26]